MQDSHSLRWAEIEALLDAALERPPVDRARWLADMCPDDPHLRREVSSLLAAGDELDGFLSRPLPLEAHRPDTPDLIGQRVGPFTLVRLLGRGGMGCVYLAERHDGAFDQRVAVKLIPKALLHDEARRRFQVEVRALARLEHPGIARILDCGVTSDGLPFLVMEYVEGEPIDHYCDQRGLGIEGRIRMLLGVAEAVRFAHSRLVVHRDLKPANILVVPPGRVKLLDFGIAKLLSEDEDGPTQTGMWPCTPQYAAPEQLTAGAVTTATDVYGIGALAYRLLVGRPPWNAEGAAWIRRLREVERAEPEPPSRAAREPGLRRRLRGDLDAVVLKALAARADHRYGSVDDLATDLENALASRPVAARPRGLAIRTAKLLRRRAVATATAATVIAAITVLVATLTWHATVARRGRQQTRHVRRFVSELLASTNPDDAHGVELPLTDLAEESVALARTTLADEPALQADVLDVLGTNLARLGQPARALEVRRRAVELRQENPEADPEKLLRGQLALVESLATSDEPAAADQASHLLARARSLALVLSGPFGRDMARVLLADARFRLARVAPSSEARHQAARTLTAARKMLEARGDESGLYADVLRGLAGCAAAPEQAEQLVRRALAVDRRLFSDSSLEVVGLRNDLALVLDSEGRREEAERLLREVLSVYRTTYGREHPQTVAVENNLAAVLRDENKLAEAEPLYREVLELRRRLLKPDAIGIAYAQYGLGRVVLGQDRVGEAEDLLTHAEHILRSRHSPLAAVAESWLAECRIRESRLDEARSMLRRDLESVELTWGPDDARADRIRGRLAEIGPGTSPQRLEAHPPATRRLSSIASTDRRSGSESSGQDAVRRTW